MVSIDAGFLGLFLHPAAKVPNDPSTGLPTLRARDRVERLMDDLDAKRERIIIPSPALAEFLVLAADDGPQYLTEIALRGSFYIYPFDQLVAVELAAMELHARKQGHKRFPLPSDAPWQKIKFDRQIVAIAKFNKAHTIYSDDGHVRMIAEDVGIKGIGCWELGLPPAPPPGLFDTVDAELPQ
jgi:predicted nucleic acid-binding protein